MGVPDPFPLCSSTVLGAHPLSFSQPLVHQGQSAGTGSSFPCGEGAVELDTLPSPGFYSRLFVVLEASGLWRPIIDLSTLNIRVFKSPFKMETLQSVLLSVRSEDWMVSLDLKDAYSQVSIHLDSRKSLRFIAFDQVYPFKALCFSLPTAPQVLTRVMARVDFSPPCGSQDMPISG